jgi:uncharacterized membrane protein YkgB
MRDLSTHLDPLDLRITNWLARHAIFALRLSVGIVFLWFGALKLVPGLSPAEGLATQTIVLLSGGWVPTAWIAPGLGAWECAIGLGLLSGLWMRGVLLLLAMQMAGTLTPLVLFPGDCFTQVPYAPTLEGQYIIKNLVLIAAAMTIGATVRGGRVDPAPKPAATGA